jgi:hypothetical protein
MPRDPKPMSIRMDKNTHAIIEAWRERFDEERPGTHAAASEVIRALLARVGMPPRKRAVS